MSEKRTSLQIRAMHNLSLEALAEAVQVPIEDIYYLEAGVPYPDKFIEKALRALSALTGEQCTLETVGGIYHKRELNTPTCHPEQSEGSSPTKEGRITKPDRGSSEAGGSRPS